MLLIVPRAAPTVCVVGAEIYVRHLLAGQLGELRGDRVSSRSSSSAWSGSGWPFVAAGGAPGRRRRVGSLRRASGVLT